MLVIATDVTELVDQDVHSLGGLVGLRAAVLRPEAVTGLVLAAAAGISSATRVGEATVTVLGAVQPGRVIGRQAHRVSRSRLGRTVAFGWWGVADPAGFASGPPPAPISNACGAPVSVCGARATTGCR